ncbi:ROK family protein [Algoriphagus zhangzhouensis]|uniref:Polyphosphate glucokinase n=1 Tax=Algoriphagus zhangzhouensis TaxID=1073327 RepID=A0A1M7Z4V3_9BACT|nr:ROK family protein [Algoriphagus zhangzhouensis]TDY48735.1 polyphosphate glucokinase/glucose-6-phosphate isomerase [Algoriphagus zhangzhouensis]SHO59874.1 polyphosphate glucokinase [Algoriphagus zhangzhouensis]
MKEFNKKILVIDIGGSNVKILATGQPERIKIPSGSDFSPDQMVPLVKEHAAGWEYDAITIGFPGVVKHNKIINEPVNMGSGWTNFDFQAAFNCPIKIINDAAMQALGSFEGKKLLFLGLGTGLGTSIVVNKTIIPIEGGHLPYKKSTFESYIGKPFLFNNGQKRWEKHVFKTIEIFADAFQPEDIVLGGGNSKLLTQVPEGCRLGTNQNAFKGGFRLWEDDYWV